VTGNDTSMGPAMVWSGQDILEESVQYSGEDSLDYDGNAWLVDDAVYHVYITCGGRDERVTLGE